MRGYRGYLAAAALLWSLTGTAEADDLFAPVTGAAQRTEALDIHPKRQRIVSLNVAALTKAIHSSVMDHARNRAAASESLSGVVTLELFDGQRIELKRKRVKQSPEGGIVWTARAEGGGYAVLSVVNDRVSGAVEYEGRHYLIDPIDGHTYALKEIDLGSLPGDRHLTRPRFVGSEALPPTGHSRTEGITRSGIATVDILVAYTSRARSSWTSGGATVAQVVDRDIEILNEGLSASGVPMEIRRVGLKAVSNSYNENTSDPDKPLRQITSSSVANFPAIRSKRNDLHADLVVMYIRQSPPQYCGAGWLNEPAPVPRYGFAVVHSSCAGTITLAHEVGHTMGLHHDRYVEPSASNAKYNYGFVSTAGNFRDIMSYPNACKAKLGKNCPIMTYYSNPSMSIGGYAAGKPSGVAGAADATRWLTEVSNTVADFR